MKKKLIQLAILPLTASLFASVANAEIVAEYTFQNETFESSDSHLLTTASDLSVGSGVSAASIRTLGGNTSTSLYPADDMPYLGIATADTATESTSFTEADGYAQSQYFEFTVGFGAASYDLVDLNFDSVFDYGHPAVSAGWSVRSSLDGFAAPIAEYTVQTDAEVEGYFSRSITLSSMGSTYESVTSDVTFRVLVFDSSSATTRFIGVDNISLDAVAVVPEPGSFALLIGGLSAAFVGLRRKRT